MPDDHDGSADEVLAALVASLRLELAEALTALVEARERIAELEARP